MRTDGNCLRRNDRQTRVLSAVVVRILAVGLIATWHLAGRPAAAQEYEIVDLGTLGGDESQATDINESGQVVGGALIAGGDAHAFLWENGTMTDLGTLGGAESAAQAINDSGVIVGQADTGGGDTHAFLWTDASGITDLGTLGGTNSTAWDINNAGTVVGHSGIDPNVPNTHAFRYHGGVMSDLGTLPGGDVFSQAQGINSAGQIVGFSRKAGAAFFRAFLFSAGTMTDIGDPGLGGDHSGALAISDAGDVVGEASPGIGTEPFLYSGGTMTSLGTFGGNVGQATDINASGVIVGWSHPIPPDPHSPIAHAFIYDADNGLRDLNDLIPAGTGWLLVSADAINDSGWIVGFGILNGQDRAFLLKPTSGIGCCCLPFGGLAVVALILGSLLIMRINGNPRLH